MAAAVENGASEAPEAPEQEEYQEEQQDDQDDINWNDMTTLASMGPADVTVDPGGEIRRVPVPALAYDDVRSHIASRLAPARLVAIKYIDEDGDKVTVALQEELEAVPVSDTGVWSSPSLLLLSHLFPRVMRAVTVTKKEDREAPKQETVEEQQLATQVADVLNAAFFPLNETKAILPINERLNFTSRNCEFRLCLLNQQPWVLKMSKSEVSNVKVLRERSIYLDIKNQKNTEAIPKVLAPQVAPASYCGRACLFVEFFQYDLSERTWSDEELLDACCWCVAGLEAIHNAGFCHGDVAPTNIWARLSPSGEWAFAVGDLGESVPLGWPVRITTEPYALKDLERTGSFAYDFLIDATVHLTSKWIEPSILLITTLVRKGKPCCCAIPFSASLYSGPSPRLDFSEITLCSEIGRGATATVYRALYREQQVAVKLFKDLENQQDRLDDFERESTLLEQLRHPCMIEFCGAVHLRGREAIVTEYLSHGSLQQAIPHLSYGMRIKCLVDSANGMQYLHESGVMHRDLKPDNHLEADVYSFAITMWAVLSPGSEPYADVELKSMTDVLVHVMKNRPPVDPSWDQRLVSLMKSCWAHDPAARPTFSHIYETLLQMIKELIRIFYV
eukprot:m51a1_g1883 putative tyrosine protein (618) ;mRNA; r:701649-706780